MYHSLFLKLSSMLLYSTYMYCTVLSMLLYCTVVYVKCILSTCTYPNMYDNSTQQKLPLCDMWTRVGTESIFSTKFSWIFGGRFLRKRDKKSEILLLTIFFKFYRKQFRKYFRHSSTVDMACRARPWHGQAMQCLGMGRPCQATGCILFMRYTQL